MGVRFTWYPCFFFVHRGSGARDKETVSRVDTAHNDIGTRVCGGYAWDECAVDITT